MADDYVIIHVFHIGDREIVLGENLAGERNSNSVIPLRNSLPAVCYGKVPEKRAIVMFERGQPIKTRRHDRGNAR